jgi:hypothetical protein
LIDDVLTYAIANPPELRKQQDESVVSIRICSSNWQVRLIAHGMRDNSYFVKAEQVFDRYY